MVPELTLLAVFGFTGSLHCIGMCGPLAVRGGGTFAEALQYQASRIGSYVLLGIASGALGAALVQNTVPGEAFSMTFGALLIALGVLTFVRRYQRFREFAPGQKLFATAQSLVQFIPSRPARYGILTALLPCGFLWSALPQAAAIASPFGAGLGMLVFGIATTPALHVGPAIVQRIAKRWPRLGELLPPVIMILAGILAISRATGGLHHHHHG